MKQIRYSLVAALAIAATLNASEDLGLITVESTTIDDKFDAKKMEVSNTTTLKGSEIEEYHAENLADVLNNNIPGLTVRKNEGDSNKIHIRGVAGEMYMGEKPGVAIVIDGVPVQERAGSVNIDMDNIESVKVIKGGASYLYGNDALAGAVVITTKRPKAKNEGYVTAESGSHGYQKYLIQITGQNHLMVNYNTTLMRPVILHLEQIYPVDMKMIQVPLRIQLIIKVQGYIQIMLKPIQQV
jgi:iron complex outermembrane receptor protein